MMRSLEPVKTVFLIFTQEDKRVAMLREKTAGYLDGKLWLPCGKLKPGELPEDAAVREGVEKAGVVVIKKELELVHLQYHHRPGHTGGDYLNHYFLVHRWLGKLSVAEPEEWDELVHISVHELSGDVIPYIAEALPECRSGTVVYSTFSNYSAYSTYSARP